jgi:aubergine-like protein
LVKEFLENLKCSADDVSMVLEQPRIVALRDDKDETYVDTIRPLLNPEVQMVVAIVPNNNKSRYDAIKTLMTVHLPVPSQVVTAKAISKPKILRAVCNKVLLQMACKLGGQLWKVKIPLVNTMILGMDIGPKTALGPGKSIVGFSATMNDEYTEYYSICVPQDAHQTLGSSISQPLTDLIVTWADKNNRLPENIIVYRDGVGEGMIDAVLASELPQFETAFEMVMKGYKPKIAFIIVKKRIHTRIFENCMDSAANPTPGTIVDNACTSMGYPNFYLVSQKVNEGTVSPTHYVVLHDTTGLQMQHIQQLTHKLTHMYYNWPGTIRVPSVCQNAHKMAYLIGQSLHREPRIELANRLYYL